MAAATQLLRGHRLWESFLDKTGVSSDHQHQPAHPMEYFIKGDLGQQLVDSIGEKTIDPQGKPIPEYFFSPGFAPKHLCFLTAELFLTGNWVIWKIKINCYWHKMYKSSSLPSKIT